MDNVVVARQDEFRGRRLDEVEYMTYFPCIVKEISADRTRVVIEFESYKSKHLWEVPATSVRVVRKGGR